MAGKLVQVDTTTISSATASVTLSGINSLDVYMFAFNNIVASGDSGLYLRVTKDVAGTPTAQSTLNYDRASKRLFTDTTPTNISSTNADNLDLAIFQSGTSGNGNGIFYLYNFNNSSEYSFVTAESANWDTRGNMSSGQGGGVYTVAEAHNGIHLYNFSTETFTSGTFTLYKVI